MATTATPPQLSPFIVSVRDTAAPSELLATDYLSLVDAAIEAPRLMMLMGIGHPTYTRGDWIMKDVRVVRSTYGSPFEIDFSVVTPVAATVLAGAATLSLILKRVSEIMVAAATRQKELSESRKLDAEAEEIRTRVATALTQEQRRDAVLETLRVFVENGGEAINDAFPLFRWMLWPGGDQDFADDLVDRIARLAASGLTVESGRDE